MDGYRLWEGRVTIFRAVSWTPNEVVQEQKMDQLAENADWLYRHTPRAVYTLPGGIKREQHLKLASGRALISRRPKTDTATIAVSFNNFFSINCEPIVTTGIVAEHQVRIFCVINGIGRLQPDHNGFNVTINIAAEKKKNDNIARSFYITWSAMGY